MIEIMLRWYFRCCRSIVRGLIGRYQVRFTADKAAPAVYVVHHQDLRGPVVTMAWFSTPLRLWVLSVFCRQKSCFQQFYEFTFTKRFGFPKPAAAAISYPLSFLIAPLMRGMKAIPVFRQSRAIARTLKESLEALTAGQSLLVCPDVDYTDTSPLMGEMYQGFLDLEKYYFRQTGKHLAFVPLYVNRTGRNIYVGRAVFFQTKDSFRQEKERVYTRLQREFSALAVAVKDPG